MTDDQLVLETIERGYRELMGSQRTITGADEINADLGLDSLLAVELLVDVEAALDVKLIGDPRLLEVVTVDDLADVVRDLLGGRDTGAAGATSS